MQSAALSPFRAVVTLALAGGVLLLPMAAHASGSGMPWESVLEQILESITGPVAKVLSVIAILATGLAMAFGEGGGGMRKLLMVVMGLSISFAATSFFLPFFGFSGGAGF